MRRRTSISLRGVGAETEGEKLIATFVLSATPDLAWIAFFRVRARYSVFSEVAVAATFVRNLVRIELPRRENLDDLLRSVERFIEGANWDVEFRTSG